MSKDTLPASPAGLETIKRRETPGGAGPDAAVKTVSRRGRSHVSAVFSLDELATPAPEAVQPDELAVSSLLRHMDGMLKRYSHDAAAEQFSISQPSTIPHIDSETGAKLSTAQRALIVNMFAELLPEDKNQVVEPATAQLLDGLFAAFLDYFATCGDASKALAVVVYATEPVRYNNGQPNKNTKLSALKLDESFEPGAPTLRDVITQRTKVIKGEVSRFKEHQRQQQLRADHERNAAAMREMFEKDAQNLTSLVEETTARLRETGEANQDGKLKVATEVLALQRAENARLAGQIVELCAMILDGGVAGENTRKLHDALENSKAANGVKLALMTNAAMLLRKSLDDKSALQARFDTVLATLAQ